MQRTGRRSVLRLEASQVTGRTEYVHNLRLPGMLYGKIFVARGACRIKRIDTSAARALAGVYRVVTIDDCASVPIRSMVRRSMTSRSSHRQVHHVASR